MTSQSLTDSPVPIRVSVETRPSDEAPTLLDETVIVTTSPTAGTTPAFYPSATPPAPPPKRLVLCFDGTCNLFDKTNTNIVRLVSYLRKDDVLGQQVYYQTGVGTYIKPGWMMPLTVKLAKIFDMAIAWDISWHIIGGYQFLMQNYTPGDKISIFGFSRGAYTARALAGMLHKVGLLTRANEEQVPFAFKMYQTQNSEGWRMSDQFKHTFCNEVQVDFLGVWDTVASVGILRSKDLPFTASDHHIRVFRHAVSLDERRCKFKANQWQEPYAPQDSNAPGGGEPGTLHPHLFPSQKKKQSGIDASPCPHGTLPPDQARAASVDLGGSKWSTDVEEVWFAGGHGDVGGGCAKNTDLCAASRIPLVWMLREVVLSNTGIRFDEAALLRDGIRLPSPTPPRTAIVRAQDGTLNTRRLLEEENWVEKLDERYWEDVKAPVSDQLKKVRVWWALEILPFTYRVPKEKRWPDNWKLSPTPNMGRARSVVGKRVKVHHSVQARMKKGGYEMKANCGYPVIEWVR